MKKIILSLSIIVFSTVKLSAQVIDTVSIGAQYANESWYSLQDGTTTSLPKTEWEIAFSVNGFSSTIHFNHSAGAKLWSYPHGTNAAWSSVDISDIATWSQVYNSAENWDIGAFDQNVSSSVALDYGWGQYNMISHSVTGDSIYIVQLSNGEYKKLDIINMAGGQFNFRIADIDNSNEVTRNFVKSDYAGKFFGYYSILNDEFLDREPLTGDWDLVFKQNIDFVPTPYLVTGIYTSPNWEVTEVNAVINQGTFLDYSSATFGSLKNTIGHDWKEFNFGSNAFDVANDLVYFVQNSAGDVWKIFPIGFGGSSNGDFIFSKEKLATAGVESKEFDRFLEIFPNPTNGSAKISFIANSNVATVNVRNLNGQIVLSEGLNTTFGVNTHEINMSDLVSGVYFLAITENGQTAVRKITKL